MARSKYFEYKECIARWVLNFAWVVEGRDDAHLPEQLLAGIRLVKVNIERSSENIDAVDAAIRGCNLTLGKEMFALSPEEYLQARMHVATD